MRNFALFCRIKDSWLTKISGIIFVIFELYKTSRLTSSELEIELRERLGEIQ